MMGLPEADGLDGRPLREALVSGPDPGDVEWGTETYDAERDIDTGTYRQQVKLSRVGETAYIDEGSAEFLSS